MAMLQNPSSTSSGDWIDWSSEDETRFTLGSMLLRREAENCVRVRLKEVTRRHSNGYDRVHGGAIMTFIDIACFIAARHCLGERIAGSVTLDLHTQFLDGGRIGDSLDVVVQIVRETGRLVFLSGIVEQGGLSISSFLATLRKSSTR